MKEAVEKLLETACRALSGLEEDPKAFDQARIRFLGRKGELAQLFKELGKVPEEERREVGRLLNVAKLRLEEVFSEAAQRSRDLEASRRESIDVTVPGRLAPAGRLHPITQTAMEVCRIFNWLGFETVEGPEVELDYYNFEALNIPKDHPARDMQDTFYISEEVVLRTHTSPIQVRTMEKRKPPVRVIAPGRTYRRDRTSLIRPCFTRWRALWWARASLLAI